MPRGEFLFHFLSWRGILALVGVLAIRSPFPQGKFNPIGASTEAPFLFQPPFARVEGMAGASPSALEALEVLTRRF